jgi:hypothetical protein
MNHESDVLSPHLPQTLHNWETSFLSRRIGWMVAVNIICMFAFEVLRSAMRISACFSKKSAAGCSETSENQSKMQASKLYQQLVIMDINKLNSVN